MAGYLGQSQPVAASGNSVETDDIKDGAVTDVKLNSTKLNSIDVNANNYVKPSTEPISYVSGLQAVLDTKTTPSYVDTKVASLVASAPATLDTLNELALALGDDANHVTTMTNLIGTKLSLSGGTLTGNLDVTGSVTADGGLDLTSGVTGNANSITLGYGRAAHPTDAIHTIRASSDNLYINADTANTITSNIIFQNDNTERMRITSTGRVLVGDSSPDYTSYKTVISGNGSSDSLALMYDGSAGTSLLFDCNAAGGTVRIQAEKRTGAYPDIQFYTGGSEKLRITSTGNVGIGLGSATPSNRLHVATGDSTNDNYRTGADTPLIVEGTTASYLQFVADANATMGIIMADASDSAVGAVTYDANGGGMRIKSGGANRMTISTTGNVLIGDGNAGTVTATTQADELVIESASEGGMTIMTPDAQSARIRITSPASNGTTNGAEIFYRQNIATMNVGINQTGGVLKLLSGTGVEALRLDANQNMGLGVTPESWSSTYDALQVGAGSSLFGHTANSATASNFLGQNVYHNGSSWQHINSLYRASHFQQKDGAFYFNQSGSGTASFTAAMTIKNDGNISIGAADPRFEIGNSGVFSNTQDSILLETGVLYTGASTTASSNSCSFRNANGVVGSIKTTGTGTLYNTGNGGGIDFSGNSNASGMTSELLDDYEEGTWTPVHQSGGGVVNFSNSKYTKVGRLVTLYFQINFSSASGSLSIASLPYANVTQSIGMGREDQTNGYAIFGRLTASGMLHWWSADGTSNATPYKTSVGNFKCSITYMTS